MTDSLNAEPQPNAPAPGLRILGIDPGLQVTGYAVLEVSPARPLVREAGIVRSAEKRIPADMASRLLSLYTGIVEVMEEFRPNVVAVEHARRHIKDRIHRVGIRGHAGDLFLDQLEIGQGPLELESRLCPFRGLGESAPRASQHARGKRTPAIVKA